MHREALPMVSIVIPCFNAASFVCDAIRSVREQSYPNIELIVVDDGSTDDTLSLVEREAGEMVLIRAPHRGISSARNRGVTASRGQLIAFMDADDVLHRDRINHQVEAFIDQPEIGLCYCAFVNFPHDLGLDSEQKSYDSTLVNRGCLCGTVMISRNCWELTGGFDESLQSGEFLEWYLRAQKQGVVVKFIDRLLYFRRTHQNNSSRRREHFSDYARLLRDNLLVTRKSLIAGR